MAEWVQIRFFIFILTYIFNKKELIKDKHLTYITSLNPQISVHQHKTELTFYAKGIGFINSRFIIFYIHNVTVLFSPGNI